METSVWYCAAGSLFGLISLSIILVGRDSRASTLALPLASDRIFPSGAFTVFFYWMGSVYLVFPAQVGLSMPWIAWIYARARSLRRNGPAVPTLSAETAGFVCRSLR
ncbi:hypothetical protein K438DRAFT_1879054 [Mycena galopus ATCC 62051]|nr:hypothetical protein K438DRAFT_1879054 [Mycena galopus ATCC 62051]